MRHTNVLMMGSDLNEQREEQKRKEVTLNELTSKLRIVQDLSKSEGWKLFVEELHSEELKVLSLLERSSDSTTLAKLTGSLLVLKSFMDWPNYVAREVTELANDLKKE